MAGQRHSNIHLFDYREKIFTPFVYQLKSTILDSGRRWPANVTIVTTPHLDYPPIGRRC